MRFAGSERGRLAWRQRGGGPAHAVVIGEERLQGLGEVRMLCQQLRPIACLARIDRVQIGRDDLVEVLVRQRMVLRAGHGSLSLGQ